MDFMKFEYFLAHYCAPAMAGIKPANIASYKKPKNSCVLSEIEKLNLQLNKKDIYIEVLCECKERVLIILYRSKKLSEYLNTPQIKNLLRKYNYPKQYSLRKYPEFLKERITLGRM